MKTWIWILMVRMVYSFSISVNMKPYENLLSSLDVKTAPIEVCIPECTSEIYCQGQLLHDIQMARIFNDSKDFVDKKLLYPEEVILARYRQFKNQTANPNREQLMKFIDENFANDPSDTFELRDFNPVPPVLARVDDAAYKKWVLNLNEIWKELAQKVNDDVKLNPDRHSQLYLPNGYIKAGGRFTEMYYWDSYWIIRGLLLSGMNQTARGIIENMLWLVKIYGHMPNGSRKYYLQRSQPPLLIQMAATYHSYTSDNDFIKTNIEYFDKEFQFWYTNRMVDVVKDGVTYKMAHYNASSCSARPESYYEDTTLAQNLTEKEKIKLFTGIKSSAESGWDFSSRHIRGAGNSNIGTLVNVDPQSFIYVDLNCILQANAAVLSDWYLLFGNQVRSNYYKLISTNLLIGIEKVLWNDSVGIWLDYDLITGTSRNYFYPSNLAPLWTGSYDRSLKYMEKAIQYLVTEGILTSNFTPKFYGVPTSKLNTTQQWDFPNCWAPLQSIVIQGLERTNHPTAQHIAFKLAQNWIDTMHSAFLKDGIMYEKYSAIEFAASGNGGEYQPQKGFGWTNGFALELLNTYGRFLKSNELS